MWSVCVYLSEPVCVAGVCLSEIAAVSMTVKSMSCICVSVCMYMCNSTLVSVQKILVISVPRMCVY